MLELQLHLYHLYLDLKQVRHLSHQLRHHRHHQQLLLVCKMESVMLFHRYFLEKDLPEVYFLILCCLLEHLVVILEKKVLHLHLRLIHQGLQ